MKKKQHFFYIYLYYTQCEAMIVCVCIEEKSFVNFSIKPALDQPIKRQNYVK